MKSIINILNDLTNFLIKKKSLTKRWKMKNSKYNLPALKLKQKQ